MKLVLTLVFFICLAIAAEAQTVTFTTPKLTTLKTTRTTESTTSKSTTPKTIRTTKSTTSKSATPQTTRTTKSTTSKSTTKPTVKTTTGKTTLKQSTSTTTKKPVTTTPLTVKSYKVCRDTSSTATSGSIQPLDGLTPLATGPPKTCSFSITAPTDQHVQMSCSVANLTFFTAYAEISSYSSSLIFDGILDVELSNIILPNKVYASYNNTMTVTYRVVNASDNFDCSWTTFWEPTTSTDYKWCRDGKTTAANGSIQTLREPIGNDIIPVRVCPFVINSSSNSQVQMSCASQASWEFMLITFNIFENFYNFRPKYYKTTSNGNEIEILLSRVVTDAGFPIDCKWTTTAASVTVKDFNYCVHVQSTASNGVITPLTNATDSNICLFSIIVPLCQHIQISCTVVNLTQGSYILLGGINELERSGVPSPDKVYTSTGNQVDVISTHVNQKDWFQCNWTTITIPTTTDFKLCLEGETTEDRGTIQPFHSRHNVTEGQSSCRFTITAPLSKRIQMTCLTNDVLSPDYWNLFEFVPSLSVIASPIIANATYNSTGNEMILLVQLKDSFWFNCTWMFI